MRIYFFKKTLVFIFLNIHMVALFIIVIINSGKQNFFKRIYGLGKSILKLGKIYNE